MTAPVNFFQIQRCFHEEIFFTALPISPILRFHSMERTDSLMECRSEFMTN